MELLAHLATGFGVAFTPANLLWAVLGSLLGLLVGVLPGITPVAAMALLLPVAYALSPASALVLLATLYLGTQAGSATAAIVAHRRSVAGRIDGYAMARQGRAGPALVAASLSTCVAGLAGLLLVAVVAPMLSRWGQAFGAPERLALALLALVGAVVLASGQLIKGLAMAALGLLLSLVGTDPATNLSRFTLDVPELRDGMGLAALAMGLFVYGDVFRQLARGERTAAPLEVPTDVPAVKPQGLWPSRQDYRLAAPSVARGGVLGALLGLLPGGGSVLSAVVSQALEKTVPPKPGEPALGQGSIRAVAACEAAQSAAARSSLLPFLALGMPANAAMALLLGVLSLHHLQPGPLALADHAPVLWGLVAALLLGSVLLVLLHVPLLGVWSRFLRVPYRWLVPIVVLLSTLGIYTMHRSVFDIWLMAGFGVLGYVFHWLELDAAPLLLGYILGPAMEDNLQAALQLSGGEWSVFVTHPASAGLLLACVCLLVLLLLPVVQMQREEAFVEDQK